jgi:hypothetical protein
MGNELDRSVSKQVHKGMMRGWEKEQNSASVHGEISECITVRTHTEGTSDGLIR